MSHPHERSKSPQEAGTHKARRQEHVPGQVGGGSAGQIARRDHPSVAESSAMAAARNPTAVVINPASTAVATRTTCPPSWFAQHLPGHESDWALWASALPDQESDLHVPLQRVLAEKLHMVRRLTRWKERVIDREQADKRASTAASALAASDSNTAADEVAEAKAAVSRFEDAALAARADLVNAAKSNSSGDTNDAHRILIDTLTRVNTDASRDLAAAQRRLREAKAHATIVASLVRADAVARADAAARAAAKAAADAAVDAAAVAAADAEADAKADARAAGIDEPATATTAEIRAAITWAKTAVACYLGIGHATSRAFGKVGVQLLASIRPVVAVAGCGPSWHSLVPNGLAQAMSLQQVLGVPDRVMGFQHDTLTRTPGLRQHLVEVGLVTDRTANVEQVVTGIFEKEIVPRVEDIVRLALPDVHIGYVRGRANRYADGYFVVRVGDGSDNSDSGDNNGAGRAYRIVVEHKRPMMDSPAAGAGADQEAQGNDDLSRDPHAHVGVNGQVAQYIGAPGNRYVPQEIRETLPFPTAILTTINQSWLVWCQGNHNGRIPAPMSRRLQVAVQDETRRGSFDSAHWFLGSVRISQCCHLAAGRPHLAFLCVYAIVLAARSLRKDRICFPDDDLDIPVHIHGEFSDDGDDSDDGDSGGDGSNLGDSNQGSGQSAASYVPSSPSSRGNGSAGNSPSTRSMTRRRPGDQPNDSNCTEVASSSGRSANSSEGTALSLGQGIHHFKCLADGSGMSEYCTEFIPLPRGPAQGGSGSSTSEYRQSPMTSQHTLQALEGTCPIVANTSSSQSRPKPISPEQAARWTEYHAANL